jgi:uncharacterized protein (DUF58 family)
LLDATAETNRDSAPADALPAPLQDPPPSSRGGIRFARFVSLLAVAILAGLIHPRALTAVAVIGTVLAVGLTGPWLVVRGVRAHWTYPVRRAQVGRPLTVQLTLRSFARWPAFGLIVRGGWSDPKADRDPVTVAVPQLPARGIREVVTTIVPERRGVFPPHAPTLACGFPFGLRLIRRPAEVAGQVLVWPELVPLGARERDATGVEGGAVVQSARSGDRGEFVGTRPYRAGEPLHRIHWKQSARHDKLIAVESRATARRAVVLVLETDPAVHSTSEGGDTQERLLSVGASLAAALTDMGIHVTLTFEAGAVFSANTRPQLATALDAMARFSASVGADQAELLTQAVGRAVRGPVPWVITTVTGFGRAVESGRTQRRRFVVIDERKPWVVRSAPRPPGLPRGTPLIPLEDPEHHGLLAAWKEVTGGLNGVV